MTTTPQTLPEKQKTERAMAALDTMATTWVMSFKLREGVKAMMALPDGEDRLVAFIKHCYGEGLYEGRTSHDPAALAAQPLGVAAIPEGPSDAEVDLLLAEIDQIAENHSPGYGLPTHNATALQSMRAQVQWFVESWTRLPQPPAGQQPATQCDTPNYCRSVQRCTAMDEQRASPPPAPPRVPLTEQDVISLARTASSENHYAAGRCVRMDFTPTALLSFAEALRAAHGIGPSPVHGEGV